MINRKDPKYEVTFSTQTPLDYHGGFADGYSRAWQECWDYMRIKILEDCKKDGAPAPQIQLDDCQKENEIMKKALSDTENEISSCLLLDEELAQGWDELNLVCQKIRKALADADAVRGT